MLCRLITVYYRGTVLVQYQSQLKSGILWERPRRNGASAGGTRAQDCGAVGQSELVRLTFVCSHIAAARVLLIGTRHAALVGF